MNAAHLVALLGYPGLFAVIFAESGFFLGAILPGDSLLFAAGLFAEHGFLSIWVLVPLCIAAAIAGDTFGYWTGKRFGRKLFSRDDSFFFRKDYVAKTEAFYAKHGKKTVVLARFIPVVRTFAPICAGIADMPYRTFSFFNIIGAALWGAGLTLAGYFLGAVFPSAESYLSYIILAIIALSFIPVALEVFSSYRKAKKENPREK